MKIKKLLALLLVAVLLFSSMPLTLVNVQAATSGYDDLTKEEGGNEQAYTDYNEREGRLHNLYSKIRDLKPGDTLNVAYYGGSITSGSGASDMDTTSWRALVGQELTNIVREYHPDTTVTNEILYPIESEKYDDATENEIVIKNINAAIGASHSFFGAYRAYEDIGVDKGIDLVFLEFTYNDYLTDMSGVNSYVDANGDTVKAYATEYESIIREIYKYAPDCEIIGIFTTGANLRNIITENKYPQLSVERAILREYDIPYLYIGRDLVNHLIEMDPTVSSVNENNCTSNTTWTTYLIDACHPNDLGYEFYADLINDYINGRLDAAKEFEQNGGEITITNSSIDHSFFDQSVLKTRPRQMRFSYLYEGYEDYLSGYEKYELSATESRATESHRTGTMQAEFAGSSFAFRFTGTSVGLFAMTSKHGGKLTAKVYNVDENGVRGSLYKTVTTKTKFTYDYMPSMFDIAAGIPYATYDVEVVAEESEFGANTKVARIFWDGDDNLVPLMHPDVEILTRYKDIEILDSFVKPEENNGITLTEDDTDGSYLFTASTNDQDQFFKLVRYDLKSKGASLENYPYIHIEYYIDENSEFPFTNLGVRARSTTSMSMSDLFDVNYTSEILEKGKWATAVIDMTDYVEKAASKGATPESLWKRLELFPYGYDVKTNTAEMNGAQIKIRSIRFSNYSQPVVSEGEDGEKAVYVTHSGLIILPDTSEISAYTNFSNAFDALGKQGGVIYFQGEFTEFLDGLEKHGNVRVVGIGDTDAQRAKNKIILPAEKSVTLNKNGNVTFENLTLQISIASRYLQTKGGYTASFGENVNIIPFTNESTGKVTYPFISSYVDPSYTSVASNFVFSSKLATYDVVSSASAIFATHWTKYTGHSNYVFNAGTFNSVYPSAYNTGSADVIGYGDVDYTFNGGTFNKVYTGGHKNYSRYGNITLTINGGTFNQNILIGSELKPTVTLSTPGYTSVIVNCKEITETETGILSSSAENTVLIKNSTVGGLPSNSMVILNNAELSENAKIAIDSSCTSDYRIKTYGGRVTPVFEESSTAATSTTAGALLGFELTADSSSVVPFCNGEELTANENGLYTLPTGELNIEFRTYNTDSVVYVSATGSDENDGSFEAPFATIDYAQRHLTSSISTEEKTIVVIGTVNFDGGEPHSEMITIKGYDSTALLYPVYTSIKASYADHATKSGVILQGPTTFDNIYFAKVSQPSSVHDKLLVNNNHEVVFRNMTNVTSGDDNYLLFGNYNGDYANQRQQITINDLPNESNIIVFGSANVNNTTNAGVDLTINGGKVANITFQKLTKYSGDVNIVINDIKEVDSTLKPNFLTYSPTFNGAFQFVINNGKMSALRSPARGNLRTVVAAEGVWIIDGQTAADGSVLTTTENEGIFQVKGNMIANAYKYDVSSGTLSETAIASKNGILDLSAAPGEYVVKYTEPIMGDATGDSKVDVRDLVAMKEYLADNAKSIDTVSCDFDKDGKITALDLTSLLKKMLNVL